MLHFSWASMSTVVFPWGSEPKQSQLAESLQREPGHSTLDEASTCERASKSAIEERGLRVLSSDEERFYF